MKRSKKRNMKVEMLTLGDLNIPKNVFVEYSFTWRYGDDEENDRWLDYGDRSDRLSLVRERYGLDELAHDQDWQVRKAVAEQGYAQEILSKDPVGEVREAVAKAQQRMRSQYNSPNLRTRVNAYWAYHWKGHNRQMKAFEKWFDLYFEEDYIWRKLLEKKHQSSY